MSFPPKSPGPKPPGKPPMPASGRDIKQRRLAWQPDGYDSEEEDPPPDEYHWQMRQFDRAHFPDPAVRAERRRKAVSRPAARSPDGRILPLKTTAFITRESHRFRQGEGNCMTNCAVFFHLRQLGYGIEETLALLDDKRLRPGITAIQEAALQTYVNPASMTEVFVRTAALLQAARLPAPGGGLRKVPSAEKLPLVWGQRIGGITEVAAEKSYLTSMHTQMRYALGRNRLKVRSGGLDAKPRKTLQASLFQGYRRPASGHQELPGSAGCCGFFARPPTPILRESLPFIVIELIHTASLKRDSHVCLLDLSMPGQPGLFDPNYGWLAVDERCDFLVLENILYACWTEYGADTFEVDPARVGLRHVKRTEDSMRCMAYQLYRQSLE